MVLTRTFPVSRARDNDSKAHWGWLAQQVGWLDDSLVLSGKPSGGHRSPCKRCLLGLQCIRGVTREQQVCNNGWNPKLVPNNTSCTRREATGIGFQCVYIYIYIYICVI